jgi:serine phosphatase RsbU (regulator of sigma subunit)
MLRSFKSRISASFFGITFLVSAFLFLALYSRAVKSETENLRSYLKNIAVLGASFIDGDIVRQISLEEGCQKDPDYQSMVQDLKKITRIDAKIDDAYVMVPSKRGEFFLFVANANLEVSPTACGEPYDVSAYPQIVNALNVADADKEITKDKWGEWLSGYAPIYDSNSRSVAVLGIDVAAKTIRDLQAAFFQWFLVVLGVALILTLLIGILSSQWLVRPVDEIVAGMERVGEGDLEYSLKKFSQKEFDRISHIFNRMSKSLVSIMAQLEVNVRERERLNRELELAADLQKKALPAAPPETKDLDIAAKSVPAKEVGGDYFDFLARDSKVGFVVADAAGKGFPGTLYMTNSRSVFRVISAEETIPGNILRRTNDIISHDSASAKGMFITFLYSVYDSKAKTLTTVNAGHYLPLIYERAAGRFKSLHTGGGLPLGVYPEQEYPEEVVHLSSGDTVVMYTDGIVEAFNERKEMFGLSRLMKIIEKNVELSAQGLLDRIETEMKDFVAQTPPFDDVTLVVFKVN